MLDSDRPWIVPVRSLLECDVRIAESSYPIVRIAGVLDVGNAATVRSTLTKVIIEMPEAIILDLADLSVDSDAALSVLAVAAREAAIWPGCVIVAHGAVPAVIAAMRRLGLTRSIMLTAGLPEAVRIARSHTATQIREALMPVRTSVRVARWLTRRAGRQWQLPEPVLGHAELIVNELVTNAVQHARTPMDLHLCRTPRLMLITVRDGDVRPAAIRDQGDEGDRGRGLILVDAVATSWGWHPTRGGKAVWATLRTGAGHAGL